jgi:phosphoenolpyruvate carboxylase
MTALYGARLGEDASQGGGMLGRLRDEFERAKRHLLAITGQARLLDHNPVIQKSIEQRTPATDLLNLLQIELIARHREATDERERARLRGAVFLAINGIAAAMQATG